MSLTTENWQTTFQNWNPHNQWLYVKHNELHIKNKPTNIFYRFFAWIRIRIGFGELPTVIDFLRSHIYIHPETAPIQFSDTYQQTCNEKLIALNTKIAKYNNHFFRWHRPQPLPLPHSVSTTHDLHQELFIPASERLSIPCEEEIDTFMEYSFSDLGLSEEDLTQQTQAYQEIVGNRPRVGPGMPCSVVPGEPLTSHTIAGDGHCMFRSFAVGLFHAFKNNPAALQQKITTATQGMVLNKEIQKSITICLQALTTTPIDEIFGSNNFCSKTQRRTHGDNIVMLLRQIAIHHMRHNPALPQIGMDEVATDAGFETFDDYCKAMLSIGQYDNETKSYSTPVYGGANEMMALTTMFNTCVSVVNLGKDFSINQYPSEQHKAAYYLVRMGLHYYIAYPTEEALQAQVHEPNNRQ